MNTLPIAAIVTDDEDYRVSNILWAMVTKLQAYDIDVGGLLNQALPDGDVNREVIQSIADDRSYKILQSLGSASNSCKLDARVLAESSIVLREAIEQAKDFIMVNKFGIAESEGRGFINEFSAAVANGIPIISVVQYKYLDAWRDFTGGLGTELTPNMRIIDNWIFSVVKLQTGKTCCTGNYRWR